MDIRDKRILITGAGRGLGRTLAFACAAAGASEVIAGVRTAEDIESLRVEALATDARVTPVKLDVTADDDVGNIARLGRVDILINNAGVAAFGNPLTMDLTYIRQEMEVNYFGALRMARACAPEMIAQGDGLIVNIASILAKVNLPMVGSYCATKAALLSLGQALRAYLSDQGVRVITVMPGTIDTDMSRGAEVPKLSKEYVAAEVLRIIHEEPIDPPIGDEAREIYEGLLQDPAGIEKAFAQLRG
jgi:NAD(P)-dependent dehydrogenase (short-subunit alcohol dehydrogenase family)